MGTSISRQLAQFAHELRYEDLPPAVVDKAKALALHYFAAVMEGYPIHEVQEAIRLVKAEETVASGGSSILVDGAKVTKAGAAQVNADMHHSIEDTYRMITHPRSEEHTSELQSHSDLVCRLLLEKKKKKEKKRTKKKKKQLQLPAYGNSETG